MVDLASLHVWSSLAEVLKEHTPFLSSLRYAKCCPVTTRFSVRVNFLAPLTKWPYFLCTHVHVQKASQNLTAMRFPCSFYKQTDNFKRNRSCDSVFANCSLAVPGLSMMACHHSGVKSRLNIQPKQAQEQEKGLDFDHKTTLTVCFHLKAYLTGWRSQCDYQQCSASNPPTKFTRQTIHPFAPGPVAECEVADLLLLCCDGLLGAFAASGSSESLLTVALVLHPSIENKQAVVRKNVDALGLLM